MTQITQVPIFAQIQQLFSNGQPQKAIQLANKAITKAKGKEKNQLILLKGYMLTAINDFDAAYIILKTVYKDNQHDPKYLYHLGLAANKIGKAKESVGHLTASINIYSQNPLPWYQLAIALQAAKPRVYREEIKCLIKAIRLQPENGHYYYVLTQILIIIKKLIFAQKTLDKACQLLPESTELFVAKGYLALMMNQHQDALSYFDKARAINPNYPAANSFLGITHLALGNLKQGWELFEWRWQDKDLKPFTKNFIKPRWQGESLENKTLLIFTEQGFGDAIQFARLIKLIPKHNSKIIIEARKPLLELLKSIPEIDEVVERSDKLPQHDYYIPLMSLTGIYVNSIEQIPNQVPYFSIDTELQQKWKTYFQQFTDTFNIGITWSGNIHNKINNYRKTTPAMFAKLATLPKVKLFCLQKDAAKDLCDQHSFEYLDDKLTDFAETAACMEQLDLVITVDTAVAHLAGALNVPVWTLLSHYADWRWLLERKDNPWYPSMRLFRQSNNHDWDSVFTEIMQNLQGLIKQ